MAFLWAFFHFVSFQKCKFTCKNILVPVFLLPSHPKFPTFLPPSLFPLFFSYSIFFSFLPSSSVFSLFPLLSFSLFHFVFTIYAFPALVSTVFHIYLDTLSSLLLPSSNQSQSCGEQSMTSSKLPSTFVLQLHQSPSSPSHTCFL